MLMAWTSQAGGKPMLRLGGSQGTTRPSPGLIFSFRPRPARRMMGTVHESLSPTGGGAGPPGCWNGRSCPLGGLAPAPAPALPAAAPHALLFSPHPDDECLTGGLALRLHREAGLKVINVAVTLGSDRARRGERLAELEQACHYLGFGLLTTGPQGFGTISTPPRGRPIPPPGAGRCG